MQIRGAVLGACLALVLLLGMPRHVGAVVYEVPILVETEDDLRDLLENGDIDDDEFARLVRLLERPLDLNQAAAKALLDLPGLTWPMVESIVRHREEVAKFRDAFDLEDAGVPDEAIRQLRPFVKVARRLQRPPAVTGIAELRGIERFSDSESPAFYLRSRASVIGRIDIGFAALLQERVGAFSGHHEDGLTWLAASGSSLAFQFPKFYVMMEEPSWGFIAGTYQVGFAERLVFDETTRVEPDGFYPDELLSEYEETGHYAVRERLVGVAGTYRGIPLGGAGVLDVTAFASYWPYDVIQDDVDSTLRPNDDSFKSGSSNPLFCDSDVAPLACSTDGTGRFQREQLRAAYTELLVGGHIAYWPASRWQVGLTSYFGMLDWLETSDLVFADSGRYPNRDTYGAVGVDLEGHVGIVSLFGEYARGFAGGNAVSARAVLGTKRFDVEISGRYYDKEYDNPHARGRAQGDEYLGQRDRDEAGGAVNVNVRPLDWLHVQLDADVWYRPTLEYTSLAAGARFDFDILDWLTLSTGLDFVDKDLANGGRDEEYQDDSSRYYNQVTDEDYTSKDSGSGMRLAAWGQMRVDLGERVRMLLFYKSTVWDAEVTTKAYVYEEDIRELLNEFYDDNFAHDHYLYLLVTGKVADGLVLSGRIKYMDEETKFEYRGESFVEGWLQARWQIVESVGVQLRYRIRGYLDERDQIRATWGPAEPIEHLLKGSVSVKF